MTGEEVERKGHGLCEGTIWLINGDPTLTSDASTEVGCARGMLPL